MTGSKDLKCPLVNSEKAQTETFLDTCLDSRTSTIALPLERWTAFLTACGFFGPMCVSLKDSASESYGIHNAGGAAFTSLHATCTEVSSEPRPVLSPLPVDRATGFADWWRDPTNIYTGYLLVR